MSNTTKNSENFLGRNKFFIMNRIRLHVYISGRVQGVFFRDSTKNIALKLGLKGWVRNLKDGRVEAIFEGESDKVCDILEWCEKGPINACVSKVTIELEKYQGEFITFDII